MNFLTADKNIYFCRSQMFSYILRYMLAHPGELLALITAIFWTITAMSFETAGKRIGSLNLNLFRLGLAIVLLSVFSYFHRGMFLPLDADMHTVLWLALSGLVGFVIGDYLLFQSFIVSGARISMLIMTLAPVFAAIAGWILLNERLDVRNIFAMFVTLSGIGLVIFNRIPIATDSHTRASHKLRLTLPVKGIFLAVGAACGQGVGLVLSKYGMRDYDPFAASHIRVITGFLGFLLLFTLLRKWKGIPAAAKDTKAIRSLLVGTVFGPFLGVSFSLMAVQRTHAGIAQTIMSLVPVLIIPPAILLKKEKVHWREIVGAAIAVAGVALFFL